MRRHCRVDLISLLLLSSLLLFFLLASSSCSGSKGHLQRLRRLIRDEGKGKATVADDSAYPNPRLRDAYVTLQAWKLAIIFNPTNLTSDWIGPDVYHYTSVFCSSLPSDPNLTVIAGVDLNHIDGRRRKKKKGRACEGR